MTKKILAALAVLLAMAVGGHAQEPDFGDIVKEIAQKLGGQDLYARGEAAKMLEIMCNHASRPGADAERAAVCRAMAQSLGPDTPKMGRVWLLRQLEKNGRAEVVELLAALFGDPDELIRQHALLALANNPTEEAGVKLRAGLEHAEDSYARIAIINAMGYRRDAKTVGALAKWMDDSDERVAEAAVAALGSIGNADALAALDKKTVPTPAGVDAYLRCLQAVSPEKPAESAELYSNLYQNATARQQKLAGLRGLALGVASEKAVEALLDALSSKDLQIQLTAAQLTAQAGPKVAAKVLESFDRIPPAAQAALLGALGDRAVAGAKETALEAINSRESTVRVAAIGALGSLGDASTALMLAQLAAQKSGAEQSAARESIAKIRGTDVDEALLAALPSSNTKVQVALLRLLGRTGSPHALEALRQELKNGAPEMHDATVRALSEWPDAAVIPDLLVIAREDPSQTNKVLALRGYVRVVALPSERRPAETARMLGEALSIAPTAEKKSILGALGAVGDVEALHLASPLMDDEQVRTEAITAALRIARAVAGTVPDEATTAANHALELSQDEAVKRNVAAIIQAAERSKDFVTDWFVAGPYMQEGKEKDALFDIEFAPEKGEDAKWTKMPANPDRSRFWEMNLDAVGDLRGDNRVAYLRTRIFVPKTQGLQLEVGSDDAIKVWVNGKLVHANNASRGNEAGQDKARIELEEGWNTMMLKVINGGGGWGANARLRTLDDKKVAGMKVKAE